MRKSILWSIFCAVVILIGWWLSGIPFERSPFAALAFWGWVLVVTIGAIGNGGYK